MRKEWKILTAVAIVEAGLFAFVLPQMSKRRSPLAAEPTTLEWLGVVTLIYGSAALMMVVGLKAAFPEKRVHIGEVLAGAGLSAFLGAIGGLVLSGLAT